MIGRRLRVAAKRRPEVAVSEWRYRVDVVFPSRHLIEIDAVTVDRLRQVADLADRYANAVVLQVHGTMEADSRTQVVQRLRLLGHVHGTPARVCVTDNDEEVGNMFGAKVRVTIRPVTTL